MNFIYGMILCFLTSCTAGYLEKAPQSPTDSIRHNFGSIFGQSPLLLKGKQKQIKTTNDNIDCVNKFLWHGALETIGFMPILSAIPNQGRIITDWYIDEEFPNIRVRTVIYILGKKLRADAVRVYVERQKLNSKKVWSAYHLPQKDCTKLEILIVERACKLKKQFQNSK